MPTPLWVQAVCAKVPTWEGNTSWLYLDNAKVPNATTGQGYLVVNRQASLLLPWLNPDGSVSSASNITADWIRVTALPGGKLASYYKSPVGLYLTQESIDALTSAAVESTVGPLHTLFPDFDSYPLSAQTAVGDMSYNLGVSRLRNQYPHFCAAVTAQDWKAAALQSGRNVSQSAFNDRNLWVAGLLNQAIQGAL